MAVHPGKLAVVIPLTVIAAFFAWYGGFIISMIFDDYKDSPDATYLTIGGASFAISALFATAVLLTVSPTRLLRGWLVLAVLALLASALPYTAMVGSVGYALHAALALLALGSVVAYLVGAVRTQHTGRE